VLLKTGDLTAKKIKKDIKPAWLSKTGHLLIEIMTFF